MREHFPYQISSWHRGVKNGSPSRSFLVCTGPLSMHTHTHIICPAKRKKNNSKDRSLDPARSALHSPTPLFGDKAKHMANSKEAKSGRDGPEKRWREEQRNKTCRRLFFLRAHVSRRLFTFPSLVLLAVCLVLLLF